ncbi:MAG: HupE/UreJ family protein [Pseudomonadota bacterium]
MALVFSRCGVLVGLIGLVFVNWVYAHGVASGDASFIEQSTHIEIGPWLYLGAKHMVTGYDHLLFLLGVVFLLYTTRDVLVYVTLFSLGHSVTLLVGVLGGIHANPYLIDAVIGLSVVYKSFDNLGGFERLVGWRPWPRLMVLGFGLCHGFGLATKIQALEVPAEGLAGKLILFNLGVELGQLFALSWILLLVLLWRRSARFVAQSVIVNTVLMMLGFLLAGYQMLGYLKGV